MPLSVCSPLSSNVTPAEVRARPRTVSDTSTSPGADPMEIARHLGSRKVVVSARRDVLRFSPHLYNEPGDIERALDEIDRFFGSKAD